MPDSPVVDIATRCFREVITLATNSISSGEVKPQTRVEPFWQFPDFKYGPSGAETGPFSIATREIADWTTTAELLLTSAKQLPEYGELVAELDATSKVPDLVSAPFLESFTRSVIVAILEAPPTSAPLAHEVAVELEERVRGLPMLHGVNLSLSGLVVSGDALTVRFRDLTIVLRATRRSDVERSASAPAFGFYFPHAPDSILEVRLAGRPFVDAQAQEQRVLTMVRLFCGAAVTVLSTEFSGVPFTKSVGPMTPVFPRLAWRKVAVSNSDQRRFQLFWEQLSDRLPTSFVAPGQAALDAVSVAHERLKDAYDNGPNFEQSVTSAVMGLEALYFKPSGEQAELVYRLAVRVARYLSHLGRLPNRTRELIEQAYDVRSGYVHGGRVTPKDKRKIVQHYGSLQAFQIEVIDLLRISVIGGILRQMEKEEFIDLIDDSLIDASKDPVLAGTVIVAKQLVLPMPTP